jgi:hypothetical protein
MPLLFFQDMSDARVTLTGDMVPVPDGERAAMRDLYLAKHPDAFYIDFGDFSFYRMDNIAVAHLNGGFARFSQVRVPLFTFEFPSPYPHLHPCGTACLCLRMKGRLVSQIPGSAYLESNPDPIAPFSGPVASHMNQDHVDANMVCPDLLPLHMANLS